MAIILSIETSTTVCSAALHQNGNLIGIKEVHTPQSAASQLAFQIDALYAMTGTSKKNTQSVAVSIGPGSYTGLRIGVATAKGICLALSVPLITIDSLHILSAGVNVNSSFWRCPMIDARRMEVYCTLLNSSLEVIEPTQARIIDKESFGEYLVNQPIVFFGDGAPKCRAIITSPNAEFIENVFPSAANMGKLALERFQSNQFEDLVSIEPNYLKEFMAKTKMVK